MMECLVKGRGAHNTAIITHLGGFIRESRVPFRHWHIILQFEGGASRYR